MAAARVETSGLVKMLLTWRSTVFSLSDNSRAMALLVLPVASRRSTCSSRSVSPCVARPQPCREVAPIESTGEVGQRSQPLEHFARASSSSRAPSDIAERDTGARKQHAQAGSQIRRTQLLPDAERPP